MNNARMLVALSLMVLAGPSHAADCLGKNARYAMEGADGFDLVFVQRQNPLAWSDLDAVLTTPRRKFKFTLTASNGYAFNYLVLENPGPHAPETTAGDDSSFRLYPFDKNMRPAELPQGEQPAPALLFIPDFGSYLWYGSEPREFIPVDTWRLKECT